MRPSRIGVPLRSCLRFVLRHASVCALVVVAGSARASITIAPDDLPDWTVNSPYSRSLSASGCNFVCTWSSSGSFPPGLLLSPLTGAITGKPSQSGTFIFTVIATDITFNRGSRSYTVDIHAPPAITTSSPTNGRPGIFYTQTLSVSDGTPPFLWSLSAGALPNGISLDTATGLLSGMPVAPGAFDFTVQVADATGATASRTFHLTIAAAASGVAITTASPLPAGTVGGAYSTLLAVTGGEMPYSWSLVSGALPPGLTLNASDGRITGTPTSPGLFTFTARVADKESDTSDKQFSLSISTAPAAPTLTISGVPGTIRSAVQVPFTIALSSPYTKPITGQVTLGFQPNTARLRDDPAIQFSTGSRSVAFTIPSGGVQAVFPAGGMAFQTGTVAGTISLSASSDLHTIAAASTVVAEDVPAITNVTVVSNASGFQVEIEGFSNSQELADASFRFTAKSGAAVETGNLTVGLAASAGKWYSSGDSTPFGGQFRIVVPFTLQQGVATGLASVSVAVQNSTGASAAVTSGF